MRVLGLLMMENKSAMSSKLLYSCMTPSIPFLHNVWKRMVEYYKGLILRIKNKKVYNLSYIFMQFNFLRVDGI